MKHQASGQQYQLEPLGFFFYLYISLVRHNSLIFYFSASKTFEKVVKFYKKMKDYVLL